MKYIFPSLYDITELVIHIILSFIEVCCYKEATEPTVPDGKVEVITSKVLRSSPYVPFVVFTI